MDDFDSDYDYDRFEDDLNEWETEQIFQDGVLDREELWGEGDE